MDGAGGMGGMIGGVAAEPSRLFQACVDRKRVEQDALLLANRIKLLKQEESKASKKILDTQKKTKDIVDLRVRNDEARIKREEEEAARDKAINEQREMLARQRDNDRKGRTQALANVQGKKLQTRDLIKQERNEILQRAHMQANDEYARAAAKRDRIRTAASALQHKRGLALADREENAVRRVEDKIQKEVEVKQLKEEEIRRMEREEVELIQRLQHTQQRQRAAYDQLEDVLQHPHQTSTNPRLTNAPKSLASGTSRNLAEKKKASPALTEKGTAAGYTSSSGQPPATGSGPSSAHPPSVGAAAPGPGPGASPRGGAAAAAGPLGAIPQGATNKGLTYTTMDGQAFSVDATEDESLDLAAMFS